MAELKEIQREMLQLFPGERLRPAHWLLSTVVEPATGEENASSEAKLSEPAAGCGGTLLGRTRQHGGAAEEILEQEVQSNSGLSRRR